MWLCTPSGCNPRKVHERAGHSILSTVRDASGVVRRTRVGVVANAARRCRAALRKRQVYWLFEPGAVEPPLPPAAVLSVALALDPPPTAFVVAVAISEAVSFTVLTTLLITLRALESAPPFLDELRFFDEAFFAGAFFAAAFFAGAFFEAFFAGAFFEEAEAFFDDAFFEAFLLAPF